VSARPGGYLKGAGIETVEHLSPADAMIKD
jgi:hypothetical protein